MTNYEFETALNDLLAADTYNDYAPNGLQIEGRCGIKKVIFGVTASQALIQHAIKHQADALVVHHGYFWKGESPRVIGMKKQRLHSLLANNINLYAYHLPLDCHELLGNNAQLAKQLKIENAAPVDAEKLLWMGEVNPTSLSDFTKRVNQALARAATVVSGGKNDVRRIAWCSGGAQNRIDDAYKYGADTYLSGEASEQTFHSAVEQGIHYIAAGHHATERGGVMALSDYCKHTYDLDAVFIDVNNPF